MKELKKKKKWDSGNVMFHKIPKQLEVAIKKSQNKYNDYIELYKLLMKYQVYIIIHLERMDLLNL